MRRLDQGQAPESWFQTLPFESHTCEMAAFGRPGKTTKRLLQVLFGLLGTPEGVPVAVEVFAGITGDPDTVGPALDRVQDCFGLERVVMVGDRGMITDTRVEDDLRPRGVKDANLTIEYLT